jgi:peroxiredoxin
MSDSDLSSEPWGRKAWTYAARYWHWPVLLFVAAYAYQQYLPTINLSSMGRAAPSFAAETVDGDSFRLADHRGQVVVVNVWATWCGPCRVELPGFVDVQRAMQGDVQFVGIAVDRAGAAVVGPYAEAEGLNFPQIARPQIAAQHFPGDVVPRTYLIDKQGRIRYAHTGVLLKWSLQDALERLVAEPMPASSP